MGSVNNRPVPCPINPEDILETHCDAFFALDANLAIQYANSKALTLWGFMPGDCIGRSVSEVFPEPARTTLNRTIQNVLRDGGGRTIEIIWPGRDSLFEFNIHVTRSGLLIYFRPAHGTAGAEPPEQWEALNWPETRPGIGVWDIDLKTQIVRGTDQFFRIMGLPPVKNGVSLETMRQLRVPEDHQRLVGDYERAIASGEDFFESEYRIVRPDDGQIRWIFGRGRVVRDASGAPARYSGVDIDVTEKKIADTALRISEERFSQVFEQSPLGKAMASADFRIGTVNPALCQMLGRDPDELIGRTLTDFVHPDDLETCVANGHALVDGRVAQIQSEIPVRGAFQSERARRCGSAQRSDRSATSMAPCCISSPFCRISMRIWRIVQALRDGEERLRKLNDTLGQQAEERARQLASSRAQLQAFFDNSPDWLTLVKGTPDGSFTFVDINPTSETAYGLAARSGNRTHGRNKFLGRRAQQFPLHYFRECARTGTTQRYNVSRTMAGRTSTIDVMFVPHPGAGSRRKSVCNHNGPRYDRTRGDRSPVAAGTKDGGGGSPDGRNRA